jgi:hypothetical protein
VVGQWGVRQLTAGSTLRNNFAECQFIFVAKSRPGLTFFGSIQQQDGSVQSESNGSNEGEIISGDDVIAVDVQKAAEKPKTFVIELQLRNYFS